MKTPFKPLVLEKLRELFRDEKSYQSFITTLADSLRSGFSPVLSEGKILGLAVSPENGKELIFQRVTEQWARNPTVLDDLNRALESTDLVDDDEFRPAPARRRRQTTGHRSKKA